MRRHPALARVAPWIVLIASLVALVALTACGTRTSSTPSSENPGLSDEQVKVVVDGYNRTVEVPADAQTAAVVGSAARVVVYAGAQDKLIAVSDMEKNPEFERPYSIACEELFVDLPSTNTGNHLAELNVDIDQLKDLAPDVIISNRTADECDALQAETGIPVLGVNYQNQLFSDGFINSLECVGEALGAESRAQAVIAKLEEWRDDLRSRTADVPSEEKAPVYFGAINYLDEHGWEGTYSNYAVAEVANVHNVANDVNSDGFVEVTLDQIGEWDPEFMFLNSGNYDLLKSTYDDNPEFFKSLKAFKSGKLYTQPFYNYNGTNVEVALCEAYFVGSIVYPERFADVDLDARYTEIFQTLLNGYDFYSLMRENGRGFFEFPPFE